MTLSRRSFLLAGGATALAISTFAPAKGASATTTTPAGIVSIESIYARVYSTDWKTRYDVGFPAVVEFSAISEPQTVGINWDERLFAVSDRIYAEVDGELTELVNLSSSGHELSVLLPVGATRLLSTASVARQYPDETLDLPLASHVSLSPSGLEDLTADYASTSAEPWGAELFVSWTESNGFSMPSTVMVRSTGPWPIPAGSTVLVRFAANAPLSLPADPELRDALKSTSRVGEKTEYELIIEDEVSAGEDCYFSIRQDPERTLLVSQASISQVVFVAASGRADDLRSTGRLCVAPVTSSGLPTGGGSRIEGA